MAIVTCKECGHEVSSTAKKCPRCGGNMPRGITVGKVLWPIIAVLVLLSFCSVEKERKPSSMAAVKPKPHENLIIKDLAWHKESGGIIMFIDVSIENKASYKIKDITIKCDGYAKSGTDIDSNRKTIYDSIEPGGTLKVKDFNMGFLNSQVEQTSCRIVEAIEM